MNLIQSVDIALIQLQGEFEDLKKVFTRIGKGVLAINDDATLSNAGVAASFDEGSRLIKVAFEDVTVQMRLVLAIDLVSARVGTRTATATVHAELLPRDPRSPPEKLGSFDYDERGWTQFKIGQDEQVQAQYHARTIALHYLAVVLARKDR